ncbi:DUF927 domain-containing protein [Aestuariivirga sp.]|uniref:DUF927 domain-containing protein n=1 Tax=Aestuariivirga sp. TaxID=2650926 RepID=UPI0039E2D9B1
MRKSLKVRFVAFNERDTSITVAIDIWDNDSSGVCRVVLIRSELDKPQRVAGMLRCYGVSVPEERHAASEFVDRHILQRLPHMEMRLLATKAGWHSSGAFVSARRTYGGTKPSPIHKARLADMARRYSPGSLAKWKNGAAALTQFSHSAVFAISHVLSGPLLAKAFRFWGVTAVNPHSTTATGKTSLLALAATCYNLPGDWPELMTFQASPCELAIALDRSNERVFIIDEFGSREALSKFRARVHLGCRRNIGFYDGVEDWLLPVLVSAGEPLSRGANGDCGPFSGCIDFPILQTHEGGIFYHNGDQMRACPSDLLQKALRICRDHSGAVGDAWLRNLTNPKLQAKLFAKAVAFKQQFIDEHCVGSNSSRFRILERLQWCTQPAASRRI